MNSISKRVVSLVLAILLLMATFTPTTVFAATNTQSGTTGACTWTLNGTELTISGNGEMGDHFYSSAPWGTNITKVVVKNGVTSIGNAAFERCSQLVSISIPNSVTSIGYYAFDHCSKLTSISIPNSVTSIGHSAFSYCIKLTNISIPNSVTSLAWSTFEGCTALTSVTIGSGVISIDSPFSGCTNLVTIKVNSGNKKYYAINNCVIDRENKELVLGCKTSVMPNDGSVISIGHSAFYRCTGLTSIDIPNSVTSIGLQSFYGCTGLTSIDIPNSVTSIDSMAFEECINLTSVIIPDSVTYIGFSPFSDCTGLKSLTMPCSLPIDVYFNNKTHKTFDNCTNIENITLTKGTGVMPDFTDNYENTPWYISNGKIQTITIENGVTNIGNYAFYNCSSLTSITIPDSVESLGLQSFYGCTGLKYLEVPCSLTYNNSGFASSTKIESITLTKGTGIMPNFEGEYTTTPWYASRSKLKSLTVKDGVANIGNYAFCNCRGLNNVSIPNSVCIVGNSAFRGCSGLTSIIISDAVTSIGDYSFQDCTNVVDICIGKSVVSIGDYAFSGCSMLGSIEVNYGNTKFGSTNNCLIDKENKKIILGCKKSVIPNDGSVTSIEKNAFRYCSGLISISIPDAITSIESFTFEDCTGLIDLTVGKGVESIGTYAFSGCSGLESITVSSGNETFYSTNNCIVEKENKKLILGCKTSTIPSDGSVISIGNNAFEDCKDLNSITIPECITMIGNSSFKNCVNLTNLYFPKSLATIGASAFGSCSKLTSIIIPDSVTSIGDNAFKGCKNLADITIGNKVISIGDSAFYGTAWYSSQPDGLIYVGKIAYKYKGTIPTDTNIVLEKDTTGIASGAFKNCTGLASISIFDNLKNIGSSAFNNCSNLKDVFYSSTSDNWAKIDIKAGNTTLQNANLHFDSKLLHISYVDWQGENIYEPLEKLFGIGDEYSYISPEKEYFIPNKEIVSGTMPNHDLNITVTYYENVILASGKCGDNISWKLYENGDLVFKGYGEIPNYTSGKAPWYSKADKVLNIRLSSGVTKIGNYAFQNCVNATNIEFGYGVTLTGKYAFTGCKSLKNISLPDSLTKIDESAFSGCTGLKNVTIPEDLTEIGAKAFYGCTVLNKVTLGGNVAQIGNQAFDNCTNLTAVIFRGEPLTSAGNSIFGNTNSNVMVYYYSTVSDWTSAVTNGTHYLGYKAFPINVIQKQDTVSANNVYYIKVIDKHNTPLSGAVVKLGDTTYTTNSYGIAYFEKPIGSVALNISCSDHNNYSDNSYTSSRTQMMDVITLSDRPSTVYGVSCGSQSIATSVCSLNCNSSDYISIVVSGYSKYTIVKYELLQGGRVIKTTNTSEQKCTFTVPSNSFEEGQNVFVKMYTSDGTTVSSALNIDVIAIANISESKLLDELSSLNLMVDFGNFGKVQLPVNFRTNDKAKIYTQIEGRTIRVGVNLDVKDIAKNFKSGNGASLRKYLEKLTDQSLSKNSFGWNDKATGIKYKISGYIDIEYLGNGEYYVKTSYVKVAVSAKLAFGGEASYLGLVGVYFKATLSADASLTLKITRYVPESGFNVDNVTLSVNDKLELEAGVYILFRFGEASVYGNVKMGFDLQLYPKTEFEHVYLKGEIGARWSLVWGLFKGEHKFVEGSIFEYPAKRNFMRSVYADALKSAYYDPANYSILDRTYLENRSNWLSGVKMRSSGSSGDQYYSLQTGTYDNIEPKIVTAGNTTVMVWLDDNPERELSNFQTLYYSVYDNEQNIWSTPRQLDQNDTFDCEFDLITDGKRIYVVYTEQKNVFSDVESLDIANADSISNYVNGIEVAFSEFENGSFSNPVYVTNNDACEIMPTGNIVDGKLFVSWVVSDNLGLSNSGNKDSAFYSEFTENGWSNPILIAENQNSLSSIVIGTIGNKQYMAYIVDSDGNVATNDDKALVLTDKSGNAVLVDSGVLSEISFTTIAGERVLMWISDGSLFYIKDIQGQKVKITNDSDILASDYRVIMSGAKTLVTYVASASQGTDVFAIVVDDEQNVSEAIRLTNTEGYIEHYDISDSNGSFLIAFNETKTLEDSLDSISTTTDLRYMIYTFDHDISLLSLTYDIDEISESGEMEFTAKLQNNGSSEISNVYVTLYDQTGNSIKSKQVNIGIKPGCIEEITFSLTIPELLQSAQYTLEFVSSDTGSDKNMDDNSWSITLTHCDFSVDVEQKIINDKNQLLVLVSNVGNLSASTTLKVFAGGEEGRLIDTLDLGQISAGHSQQCIVELEGLIARDEDVITCVVSTDSHEIFTTNNTDSVKLLRIDNTGYSETEEESIENPVLHTNAVNYDKYLDDTVSITIEVGVDNFDSIKGLIAGTDYTINNDTVTLQKSYLDKLDGQIKLDFVFDYGENRLIDRSFQIIVSDSTPISIDGSISVDGNMTVGSTVMANMSNLLPINAEVMYSWLLDGEIVGNGSSFTIPLNASGKTLTLKVIGTNGFSGEKVSDNTVMLRYQDAPKSIILQAITESTINIAAMSGAEYSIDGINWQKTPLFEQLLPNHSYTVYARYAESPYAYVSDYISIMVTTLKTKMMQPSEPVVSVCGDTYVELMATEGYEYRCNDGNWQYSPLFENLIPNTTYAFYQRIAETETSYASPESEQLPVTTILLSFNLSGEITSFGSNDESVTVRLLQDDVVIQEYIGKQNNYSFDGVPIGAYTIEISKKNHASRTYFLECYEDRLLLDVKIHLLGDINGDGKVNVIDVAKANAHAKKTVLLEGYDLLCADVSGDGKVNVVDVAKMNAHAKKTVYLW